MAPTLREAAGPVIRDVVKVLYGGQSPPRGAAAPQKRLRAEKSLRTVAKARQSRLYILPSRTEPQPTASISDPAAVLLFPRVGHHSPPANELRLSGGAQLTSPRGTPTVGL